jgi:hypothetical protein
MERGTHSNAFKDWKMGKRQVFIPVGITDISRGSRSDSDDHPRLKSRDIRTPEGVQERSVSPRTSTPSATHSGVESIGMPNPGWSSLSRLDPGLISPIPPGSRNKPTKMNP